MAPRKTATAAKAAQEPAIQAPRVGPVAHQPPPMGHNRPPPTAIGRDGKAVHAERVHLHAIGNAPAWNRSRHRVISTS